MKGEIHIKEQYWSGMQYYDKNVTAIKKSSFVEFAIVKLAYVLMATCSTSSTGAIGREMLAMLTLG